MFAKLYLALENPMNVFLKKYPMLTMIMLQLLTALCLITAVSGVAFVGGVIILAFYKIVGVM